MWKCKHCKKEYDFATKSQKANHSRWCIKNPKRNTWNKSQGTISRYGEIKEFEVECLCCSTKLKVSEREKLHPQKEKYYCSRSCANNRQEWWKDNASHYRTIAFQHWACECAICGFDKIVAIHHIDEDHFNNNPKNLIPLCPNHHEMVHSKWSKEIVPLIEEAVKDKWGCKLTGKLSPLQGDLGSSSLPSSTIFGSVAQLV